MSTTPSIPRLPRLPRRSWQTIRCPQCRAPGICADIDACADQQYKRYLDAIGL